jgi:flagellin
LVGPGADTDSTTLRSLAANGGTGGNIIVGDQAVTVAAGEALGTIATNLNTVLTSLTPPGSAVLNTAGQIEIETAGNTFTDDSNALSLTGANTYVDGRLDGKVIVIEAAEGGTLQVGPNDESSNRIAVNIGDMRASGSELNLNGLSVSNLESSRAAISRLDTAILAVTRQRGELGAVQNRLQFTTANLANAIENLQAAESAIRDADMAEEISQFARDQILTQAATAMVAQANTLPQSALQLLQ